MDQISLISKTNSEVEVDSNSIFGLQATPDRQISQWLWQSDSDPWKEKDPTKWVWTPYVYDTHCLIEKAFICNHSIVDLGNNYEIDLKKMLQVSKQDRNKVRRVKREAMDQSRNRFLLDLEPLTIEKGQKTANPAFGNVQHFLNYIMQRTTESYNLYQKLKDLTHSSNKEEYQEIVEEVISCIQRAAHTRAKIIKIRTNSPADFNFIFEANCIIDELSKNSGSLKDFLLAILRVYTMESFICYWLNDLLRSENWEELNVLTPYLVCLAYTFKHQDYVMKYNPALSSRVLFGLFAANKLLLYRGTALIEEHLAYYDISKAKCFSWNGVTSTSLLEEPARNFMNFSVEKAKLQKESKVGVLFTIESDFGSSNDCEGMIDVSSNSKFPDEKEVILAPGTVFKLLSVQRGKGGIVDIRLKVTKKFDNKKKKNVMLLGTLQEKVIFKDRAIFNSLTKDEMIQALQLLEGHQMITKLEIMNCSFDSHLMELIANMRLTTKIKLEDIVIKGNEIKVDRLNQLWYYFGDENLDMIYEHNLIVLTKDMIEKSEPKAAGGKLQKLCLGAQSMRKLYEANQLTKFFEIFRAESRLVKIDLSCCRYLDEKDIMDDILMMSKLWPCLECLSLDFEGCTSKGDDIIESLRHDVSKLERLNNLSLNFSTCSSISNKSLSNLGDTIKVLTSLQRLSLNFYGCSSISNEGISSLRDAIKVLTSLQHLNLNFRGCSSISNEGLSSLRDAIKVLTSLQHLSLYFSECPSISNEGLSSLRDAIKVPTSLQYLSLNFSECSSISNEGLSSLRDAIKVLTSLQHLSLDFSFSSNISNEGLSSLRDAIKVLTSLQRLSLNFEKCSKISNEGLSSLRDAIKALISLQHLSLTFSCCPSVSNEGLSSLRNAIKVLTSLQHLSLNFHGCSSISNEGLSSLRDAIKVLTSLQHLSLSFWECSSISNEGISSLRDAIKVLTSLQYLSLNFSYCSSISNEGLSSLRDAIKVLTSLQHLSLDFSECPSISNEGLSSLRDAIKVLTSLQYLGLDFSFSSSISNKGLSSLRDAIKVLTSLQHLSLNFRGCSSISNEGLSSLRDAIKVLTSLRYLTLIFCGCSSISKEGISSLRDAIKEVTAKYIYTLIQ